MQTSVKLNYIDPYTFAVPPRHPVGQRGYGRDERQAMNGERRMRMDASN